MPAEKSLAIVLRLVEFSETSLVVTLFTREFGKISALAKGARRPKGPFEAALDLLALCRVVFLHKSSDALDLLTEAKLERRFRAAARDLARLYAGYYVAELLAELTDEDDPHPELFDEANRALIGLDGDAPVATTLLSLELTALKLLGHLPSLGECVGCGEAIEGVGRVSFGLIAGGVLCARCRAGQRSVVSVSATAVERMRRLADEGSEFKVEISEEADRKLLGEIRGLMNNYLAHHVGHKLRMHQYVSRTT